MNMYDAAVTMAGVCILSAVCLLLLIGLYIRHGEYHATPGKINLTLSTCLFVLYVLYAVVYLDMVRSIPKGLCQAIAVLSYFLHFASLTWITVMAYDIFRSVSSMKSKSSNLTNDSSRYRNYSVFAWLMVLAFLLPTVIVAYFKLLPVYYRPVFGIGYCGMGNQVAVRIFLEAPSIIFTVVDCIFLGVILRSINRVKAMMDKADIRPHNKRFRLCIKLVLVTGVTQATYYLHYIYNHLYLKIAISIFNCLYGVLFFLVFGWTFFACRNMKNRCASCFRVKGKPLVIVLKKSNASTWLTESTDL